MRLLVAGSREGVRRDRVQAFLTRITADLDHEPEMLIHGDCRGVDHAARDWAMDRGIPTRAYPADWDKHGKKAGPIRNREMAEFCDTAILFRVGKSRGTTSMANELDRFRKPYLLVQLWSSENAGLDSEDERV